MTIICGSFCLSNSAAVVDRLIAPTVKTASNNPNDSGACAAIPLNPMDIGIANRVPLVPGK